VPKLSFVQAPFRTGLFQRDTAGKIVNDSTGQPIISQPWIAYLSQIAISSMQVGDLEVLQAFDSKTERNLETDIIQSFEALNSQQDVPRGEIEDLKALSLSQEYRAELLRELGDVRALIDSVSLGDTGETNKRLEEIEMLAMLGESGRQKLPYFIADTRANRVKYSASPALSLYYETDTTLYYMAQGNNWVYVHGIWQASYAVRPNPVTVMTAYDDGILYKDTTYGVTWRFNFSATQWDYVEGIYSDTLANIPTGLIGADVGFRFWVTVYQHELVWNGAVWTWGPGETGAHPIEGFPVAPDSGYALCDGSATTYLQSDGTTGAFVTPNLVGQYLKLNNAGYTATAAAGGSTGTPSAVAKMTTDPAGTNVGSDTHTHGPGSLELARTELLPYFRR
jgi:hypothetical protein